LIYSELCDTFSQKPVPHAYLPIYRPARIFTPQIESANQVQQVVGEKDHFQPGFVRWETVTTRLIPMQGVLAFFDPGFQNRIPIKQIFLHFVARYYPKHKN